MLCQAKPICFLNSQYTSYITIPPCLISSAETVRFVLTDIRGPSFCGILQAWLYKAGQTAFLTLVTVYHHIKGKVALVLNQPPRREDVFCG